MSSKKLFLLFFLFINSCEVHDLILDEIVYSNDFEKNSKLEKIVGGIVSNYNGYNLLGDYNNSGFSLHLKDLKKHDFITVSFDLYIHGSWDGNFNGFSENDKPDTWTILLGPRNINSESIYDSRFTTTFSNSVCFSNYCLRQSYPQPYPFEKNPKSGMQSTNLPKKCEGFWGGKTTLYKIEKTFKHSGSALIISFFDELYQPNAIDDFGNNVAKCDESWSLDNLKVRILNYD